MHSGTSVWLPCSFWAEMETKTWSLSLNPYWPQLENMQFYPCCWFDTKPSLSLSLIPNSCPHCDRASLPGLKGPVGTQNLIHCAQHPAQAYTCLPPSHWAQALGIQRNQIFPLELISRGSCWPVNRKLHGDEGMIKPRRTKGLRGENWEQRSLTGG
jgi:hypothetical protein